MNNKDATKQIIGQRILRERNRRGWSQNILAEKMQTAQQTINRWENGKSYPHPHHKKQLSILFDMTIDELFGDQEELEEQEAPRLQQLPQTPPIEVSLTKDHNRRRMLEKVHTIWINGLLTQSLEETPFITLHLHESPDAVTNSWKQTRQDFHRPGRTFASNTPIEKVYVDAGRELLILGEPGSGKTTLLLELTRVLLQQAMQDETLPMPVLFNLASWTTRRQPIARWLVEELGSKYQVPHKLSKAWVDNDLILPLLDGLDEVAPQHRALCVEAINTYRQRGLLPLVVCSREAEYRNLTVSLHLQNAVVIQPQTPEQIDEYLSGMGKPLESIRQALRDDTELRKISANPLMLKVLVAAYQGKEVTDLLTEETQEVRRQHIFNMYVQQMLHRRGINRYAPAQTILWLHWLAHQLSIHNENEFHIEYLQPDWLPDGSIQWLLPAFAVGLVYGIFFGIIKGASYVFMKGFDQYGRAFTSSRGIFDGILIGLLNVLLFTLLNGVFFGILNHRLANYAMTTNESQKNWQQHVLSVLGSWPVYGLLNGALNGVLISILVDPPAGVYNGLFIGLVYAGLGTLNPKIQPMEVLAWSWEPLKRNVVRYASSGLLVGLGYGLLTGVYWQIKTLPQMLAPHRFLPCLLFGLSIGCILGVLIVLTRGLSSTTLDEKNIPNQGIWNSARNSALLAVLSWLLVGLFFGAIYGIVLNEVFNLFGITYREYSNFFPKQSSISLGFTYGLVVGAFFWLRGGGTACIQHLSLRLLLFCRRAIPWDYADFLNEAAERLLLRKVGGGYIFFHPLLHEYFRSLT